MRVTVHAFNLVFLFWAFLSVLCAKHCFALKDSITISSMVDVHYVYWSIVLSVVCAIVSIAVYGINLKKWKVPPSSSPSRFPISSLGLFCYVFCS
jgi:hypothetical protein